MGENVCLGGRFNPGIIDTWLYPGKIKPMKNPSHVVFAGSRRLALGGLDDVMPVLKRRFDSDAGDPALTFELESGRQVDFDLRAPLTEILERESPSAPRGPGRPRLGVASREISLLPRHWDWLEQQPSGASAALRRLVDHAIKTEPGRERARRLRAALSNILSAVAGNRPHFEEACRALFAGDLKLFAANIERWPRDLRDFALAQATLAHEAESRPQSEGSLT